MAIEFMHVRKAVAIHDRGAVAHGLLQSQPAEIIVASFEFAEHASAGRAQTPAFAQVARVAAQKPLADMAPHKLYLAAAELVPLRGARHACALRALAK